jgi:hypothetical protein
LLNNTDLEEGSAVAVFRDIKINLLLKRQIDEMQLRMSEFGGIEWKNILTYNVMQQKF